MKPLNLDNIEEMGGSSFKKLPAGGYVCIITDAESNDADQYMKITYDIYEGEFKKYYSDEFGQKNPWAHSFRSYWKGGAAGMYKHFLSCIDKSNGTNFVEQVKYGFPDEALKMKLIGVVFQAEEYLSNKGDIRTRLNQDSFATADEIRTGQFKVPELIKYVPTSEPAAFLKPTGNEDFMKVSDSELPQEW